MGFEIGKLTRLYLGYVGEADARTITIDASEWLEKWPGATIVVQVVRPDGYKYFAATEMEKGVMTWEVTAGEVSVKGKGFAQITAVDLDTNEEYKSRVVGTIIAESLEEFNSLVLSDTDPAQKWVNKVLDAAKRAEDAVGKMPIIGENGNWWLWDADSEDFVDSGAKADGLNNLVDGAAVGSVKHVQALAEGELLYSDLETPYKQGARSLALGVHSAAVGPGSACLGTACETRGQAAFAACRSNEASGYASAAFGMACKANGVTSFAANAGTEANGYASAVFGRMTFAAGPDQMVVGRQNLRDEEGHYAFIVGNGDTQTAGEAYQSNAHTVDWEGNGWFAGAVEGAGVTIRAGDQKVEIKGEGNVPHQQLITDGAGKAAWAPRLAYTYQGAVEILPETALSYLGEEDGMQVHLIMTPLAAELEQGKTYTVRYNGAEYVCPVVYMPGETADQDGCVLGNTAAVGFEATNADAPFVLMRSVSYEENGYYAMCVALDGAVSVTLSITGEGEEIHKLPHAYYDQPDMGAMWNQEGYVKGREYWSVELPGGEMVFDPAQLESYEAYTVGDGMTAYKISDIPMTKDTLDGAFGNASIVAGPSADDVTVLIDLNAIQEKEYMLADIHFSGTNHGHLLAIYDEGVSPIIGDITFGGLTPGTYVMPETDPPPYVRVVARVVGKQLDRKYGALPKGKTTSPYLKWSEGHGWTIITLEHLKNDLGLT